MSLELEGSLRGKMKRALAYIDLLGFSNMVTADYSKARNILSDFYNIAFSVLEDKPLIKTILVSDSLIAHSDNHTELVNCITQIFRECIKKNNGYTEIDKFVLLPRGAISFGAVTTENRTEIENIRKNFIISPALVHNSTLEQTIKGSRLLIAIKWNTPEENIEWHREINSIMYDDDTLSIWDNYIYKDLLWFTDTTKNAEAKKNENIELLNISFKLLSANKNNAKILPHYLATLRIGLLSYTNYINIFETDQIVNRLLNEFSDNKYWIIWKTLIEMVMQYPDNSLQLPNNIRNFYKNVSLKSSWSLVIKEINRKGQVYTKSLFEKFLVKFDD